MKTLVMGAAVGYYIDLLKPFLLSLRRYYDGECVIITHPLSILERKVFEDLKINTYELENPPSNPKDIQVDRYYLYQDIMEFCDADVVLNCDVRDVMFQDDPFRYPINADLAFFAEPCLFKDCSANFPWIGGLYGAEGQQLVEDKWVICSGTTMGTRKGVAMYYDKMIQEIERIRATGRPLYQGEDQPIHNYLIYTNTFNPYIICHNGKGPITTVHHQQKLTFNRMGEMLNDDGTKIPIIHQWDRADALKSVLEKTALHGPLKMG
jgi:hypothetical protein